MTHAQTGLPTDQQRQIHELGAKIESKAASLDLQATCSRQARQE
jgi:hypothetical protein